VPEPPDTRMIEIKSPEEQAQMRAAGRLTADVLDMIGQYVEPGITTNRLDELCQRIPNASAIWNRQRSKNQAS